MIYTISKPLRVGTDCSGIEAPIQALLQLKIPFYHVFSSEIDKYCIEMIKSNYCPEILFGDTDNLYPEGDITKRDISLIPDIDLYVCGFPCQPFSTAGPQKGFQHKSGNVFWSCLEVIRIKQPSYFILENVRGLIHHNKGNTWKVIWSELEKLSDIGYNVTWKILNTRDYGIPQNRERVYIIGIKNQTQTWKWPNHIKMPDIRNFVDRTDTLKYITSEQIQKYLDDRSNNTFISLESGRNHTRKVASDYAGCITANTRMWCIPMGRYANCKELMALQGITDIKQVVSNTQFKKQIGNSMSVNVLREILRNLLS